MTAKPLSPPSVFCWLLFSWLISFGVIADQTPDLTAEKWLTEMTDAMKTSDYMATIAYLENTEIKTFQIFHTLRDGVERERIIALNSPMNEVVLDADHVAFFYPESQIKFIETQKKRRSILVNFPADLNQQEVHYQYQLAGGEKILGRETQIVLIKPKDDLRFERRFWIDRVTHLPLQFKLIGEDGQLIKQFVFTALTVGSSVPDEQLSAMTRFDPASWKVRHQQPVAAPEQQWEIPDISGFRQVLHTQYTLPGSDQQVEHLLLSDGFASVSVYLDRAAKKSVAVREKKLGAIHAYSRQMGPYQVTVMGAVPVKTVQQIANTIRRRADD